MKKAAALSLLAVLFAAAVIAQAQEPKKVSQIGAFLRASAAATAHLIEAFREGLREPYR